MSVLRSMAHSMYLYLDAIMIYDSLITKNWYWFNKQTLGWNELWNGETNRIFLKENIQKRKSLFLKLSCIIIEVYNQIN